jgi:hypothetical protein
MAIVTPPSDRSLRFRHDFVEHDHRGRRRGVGAAGGTMHLPARLPVRRIVGITVGVDDLK